MKKSDILRTEAIQAVLKIVAQPLVPIEFIIKDLENVIDEIQVMIEALENDLKIQEKL